jgi:MFS family permease
LIDDYQFTYLKILTNFRAVLSLASAIAISIVTLFFDAIISPHFE